MANMPPIIRPVRKKTCWAQADEQICQYQRALENALSGKGKAHPDVCRRKIDDWLEYRFRHTSTDTVEM